MNSTSERRCIYTNVALVAEDDECKPSHEHIIPLSLGGSNGFTTDDVCAAANARAGNEIDDAVASLLPWLMLRHRFQLVGNRKVIPSVKLSGEFIDIDAKAALDIDKDANITFEFTDEQTISGNVITLGTTEERARFLLQGRLKSAKKRQTHLLTPFGEVKDEEDIEIALMCAERNEGKTFKGGIKIDLRAYYTAVARLNVKIAIGLAHRVLGDAWTFGSMGDLYRSELFRSPESQDAYGIKGTISETIPGNLAAIFQVRPGVHSFGIFPLGNTSVAVIALFGGECGIASMDLGFDWTDFIENALDKNIGITCLFEIPIEREASKRQLVSKTLQELAAQAAARSLI